MQVSQATRGTTSSSRGEPAVLHSGQIGTIDVPLQARQLWHKSRLSQLVEAGVAEASSLTLRSASSPWAPCRGFVCS